MAAAALLLLLQIPDPAGTAQFEPLYRAELALREKQHGEKHPRVAQALRDLALFLKTHSRKDEARDLLARALAIQERAEDCFALAELSPPHEAGPLLERSLRLKESPEAHHRLADLLAGAQHLDPARQHYERAVELYAQAGSDHLGLALNDLGFLHESQERFKEAEVYYRRALAAHQKAHGPKHPEVGITLNNLGSVVGAQGRLAEAEPLLRQALTTLEQTLGNVHERTAACASNLGDLLSALNRPAAAKPLYNRALRIYEQLNMTSNAAEIRERLAP